MIDEVAIEFAQGHSGTLGIVTRKTSPDFLMVVNLISPDHSLDRGYISNYALTQVRDRIARLDGVGDARLFGSRDYAMRIWIDPNKAAALNLTAGEIVGELVLAIKLGTPLKTLADVIHPFPAFNRVLGASLDQLAVKVAPQSAARS